ncbi:kinase-like domain-containing protein [Lobosporangium transversale]|uniref:Kinase-like domain-containing protein n=1 Tax=Lobosporangium transversale TaxID=64571 RepID=A0A1Y2GS99_9FUNG|nr:kinase-like domain-containing protein [Lobosporangium transversale]ORZ21029.1 kinase-like domain-containing protein [Lobosporangium transversale]|eukprot:XP_021882938.1 kinase-like domain-containing protein [Lobosporangium transversale]
MSTTPAIVPCKYKTGRTLGEGTYAVVKEGVHIETGKKYAVKVISKKLMEGKEHMIRNEIAVLRRISIGHPNILTLVDYFETLNNLYLVTELAEGGELFDRISQKGSYYERDAAHLVATICSGVAYLHEQGVVHRDLKPENLLFKTADEDSRLLIADFGLSRIIDHESFHVLTTTCGTPGYMAPEIFKKSGHGKPVDMWALGVITYFLLCGYTPFDRQNSMDEMHAILHAEYHFEPIEYWEGVSETAKSFVSRLLTVDPDLRMTAAEALQHPWLTQLQPERSQLEQQHQQQYQSTSVSGLAQAQEGSLDMEGVVVQRDLLPNMKARMNAHAKNKFRNAVQVVKAINKMRSVHEELARVHPEDPSHVLRRDDDMDMV